MRRAVVGLLLAFSATLHAEGRHRVVHPFDALAEKPVGQLRLGQSDAGNGPPRLATSGDETLVVWGHGVQDQSSTVEYAFIGDPLPRTLPGAADTGPFIELVFDGAAYVIRDGDTLYRLDRTGKLLTTELVPDLLDIASDRHTLAKVVLAPDYEGGDFIVGSHRTRLTNNIGYRSIATNGNGYLAAWSDLGADKFELFASDGTPLGPPTATGLIGYTITAVWTGHDYLVLDNQNADLGNDDAELRGVHVALDGSVSKPVTVINAKVVALTAASDGTTVNVAWTEAPSGATYAARIIGDTTTPRTLIDPGSGISLSSSALPALTAYNGKFAAAQSKPGKLGSRVRGYDVYAVTFSSDEALTADLIAARGVRMSTQAPSQLEPAVAANAAARAIVWRESDAIWMSINGGTAAPVSPSATTQVTPSIATNGVDFFVAWAEGSDIRVSRVDAAGHASPAASAGSGSQPAIACGADDCAVSFRVGYSIAVRRVAPDGLPLDAAPLTFFSPDPYVAIQTIGWTGHTYLVVWFARRGAVFAADVNRSGATDVRKIGVGPDYNLRIASNGNDTVVVWSGGGVRLNSAGDVVQLLSFPGTDTAIAWTGREFLAISIDYDPTAAFATSVKLFAVRVGIDQAPIVIENAVAGHFAGIDSLPALASAGDGTATVVYGRLRPESPFLSSMRLFVRKIGG